MPELKVRLSSVGRHVAMVANNAAQVEGTEAMLTSTVIFPGSPSMDEISASQQLIHSVAHGLGAEVEIAGARGHQRSSSMLQNVLDDMPRATLSIPASSLSTMNTQSVTKATAGTSSFGPKHVAVTMSELTRHSANDFVIGTRIQASLDVGFDVGGTIPGIHFHVTQYSQLIAKVEILPFELSQSPEVEVAIRLVNDDYFSDNFLLLFKGLESNFTVVRVSGRSDHNILSRMLAELDLEVDIGSNTIDPLVHINTNIRELSDSYLQFESSISLTNFEALGIGFVIPGFSLSWKDGDPSADSSLLTLHANRFTLAETAEEANLNIMVSVSKKQGFAIGRAISSFLDDGFFRLTFVSHVDSSSPFSADPTPTGVFLNFGTLTLNEARTFKSKLASKKNISAVVPWKAQEMIKFVKAEINDNMVHAHVRLLASLGLPERHSLTGQVGASAIDVLVINGTHENFVASVSLLPIRIENSKEVPIDFKFIVSTDAISILDAADLRTVTLRGSRDSSTDVYSVIDVILSEIHMKPIADVDPSESTSPSAPLDIRIESDYDTFNISFTNEIDVFPFETPMIMSIQPMKVKLLDVVNGDLIDIGIAKIAPMMLKKSVPIIASASFSLSPNHDLRGLTVFPKAVGDFINGLNDMILEFEPMENADAQEPGLPVSTRMLYSAIGEKISDTASMFEVDVTSLNLIGADKDGRPLEVPCIIGGPLCPHNRQEVSASTVSIEITFDISSSTIGTPLRISTPRLTAGVDYEMKTPVLAVSVDENYVEMPTKRSKGPVTVVLSVNVEFLDFVTIGEIYDLYSGPLAGEMKFRLQGLSRKPGVTYASHVFSKVNNIETVEISAAQAGMSVLDPDDIDYALVKTTSASAIFKASMQTNVTLPVEINLGPVNIVAMYQDIPVVKVDTNVRVLPDKGIGFDFTAQLVGDREVPEHCLELSSHTDRRLCTVNKFINELSRNFEGPGRTQARVRVIFTNVHKKPVSADLNLVLFEPDEAEPDTTATTIAPEAATRSETPNIIKSWSIDTSKSVDVLFRGIFTKKLLVPAKVSIQNPLKISFFAKRIRIGLVVRKEGISL